MVAMVKSGALRVTHKGNPIAWWAAMSARITARRTSARLSELPEHLRKDVGVDGGLPLGRFENGGRVFISYGRPDSTLSGWHW